ncbi:MAG TPA: cupin domain-containing protein [Luteitalea sp.]|nr:cupin domain-containing protein [Luteitalea sp.]
MVPPITTALVPGMAFHRLWGADVPPVFPDDGAPPAGNTYFPPLGGFRFLMFTVPAGASAAVTTPVADIDAAIADFEANCPGLLGSLESMETGMHTSDTIDFEYVISGEVDLELDNGETVHLRAGDVLVQNGTRHSWHNHGAEPCVVVACLIGTPRRRT